MQLAIKIPQGTLSAFGIHLVINRLNKLAKNEGIQQRRTFVKEVKNLRLDLRHFRHVKKRRKAKHALKRLRTNANVLICELRRELLEELKPSAYMA